ncbi:hypothetical protein VOLCADRAFT_119332 [Volvox carteri f. nagariensis]|uniref:Uncharacterized protein n=1 Tax=Volvox carteri f. nagariensis TaxID=3068 RepID=D8UCA1_VOLCA|nr:uncharacterized protein VOLCADRAFT_119332 [Volvox carteri f. nagariensis]EFJ42661.1 hypothetical protein VOLCADRAFT_119332 [Volvox carteri f. nagariensis]|eukprot:XP_002956312.1 hypothetical protein VOLCADRAFT_119332 [Volvox carteri f. nagariensis]
MAQKIGVICHEDMRQEPEALKAEAEQVLARCRALSSRALTYCNRIVGESDALAVEIKSLLQTITTAEKQARGLKNRTDVEAVGSVLKEARNVMTGLGPGGDLRKFCKPKNPLLVRLLLGDKINLVAMRRDVSQGIREEYHRFRDTSAAVMLLGPLSLVVGMSWVERHQGLPFGTGALTPWLLTGVQLYLAWLSYFYLAMALRENVLYVNGSRIRSWWIQHHYWSAAASLVILGLPVTSPAVHLFFRYFLLWSVFQAAVMFVQNRYQRRRMYTRIALGRDTAMAVVAGESSGSSGQLLLLYPMLYTLQVLQVAIGAGVAWRTYPAFLSSEGWLESEAQGSDLRGMRGVCVVGIVFAYMGYRNFVTTLLTMLEKRGGAAGRRRRASASAAAPAPPLSPEVTAIRKIAQLPPRVNK